MSYIKGLSYFGSKYSSLDLIIPKIQDKINAETIFIDCFSGGLNISLNINAIQSVCIEADTYISNLFYFLHDYFNHFDFDTLIDSIKHLSSNIIDKKSYYFFRSEFNNKDINKFDYYHYYLHLLVLYYHSFNNTIRINSNNEFNSSYGYRTFTKNHEKNLLLIRDKFIYNNFIFINNDFFNYFYNVLIFNDLTNHFFYFDPPYFNSSAEYNKTWTINEEYILYKLLQELIDHRVNFALSNYLSIKDTKNTLLLSFFEKNKNVLNLFELNNASYNSTMYNRKFSNDLIEVFIITNYT